GLAVTLQSGGRPRCGRWRLRRPVVRSDAPARTAQSARLAQCGDERSAALPRLARTGEQVVLDVVWPAQQRFVPLARCGQFGIDALEQLLLGLAPADAVGEGRTHRVGFLGIRERLEDREQVRAFCVLRLTGRARVGDDAEDRLL